MNDVATSRQDPHAGQPVLCTGAALDSASAVIIMLHGRGSSAENILQLAGELEHPRFAYLAPQAAGNTWYPYTFLAPLTNNEPYLSSALAKVASVLSMVTAAGIPASRTMLLGFSQGACLASEFMARNAQRFGGLAALSGGLIGPDGTPRDYPGTLDGTPIFLGCSDIDAHIPKERVLESADVFRRMGGDVTARLYPQMGHTINTDELQIVQSMMTMLADEAR